MWSCFIFCFVSNNFSWNEIDASQWKQIYIAPHIASKSEASETRQTVDVHSTHSQIV